MRSLEECRAEIFARSEKRIAKRRKLRRRLVAGLCPFCLCLALLVILPMWNVQKNYECLPEEPGNAESAVLSRDASVICQDGERRPLPEATSNQLSRLLDAFLSDGEQAEPSDKAAYEIEIPTADGTTVRYLLSDRTLSGRGRTVKLSEEEWQQILTLLQPDP